MTTQADIADTTENNEENAPNEAQQEQEAAAPELTVEELKAKYAEVLKESRKHEEREKANREKAKAYDEYLEAQKPVEQKNAERLAALEAENKELKLSAVKSAIAAKYGFNEAAMKRLSGSNAEELEADAKDLKELLGLKAAPAKPDVKPVATQGNPPGSAPAGGTAKTKAEWLALRSVSK